MKRTMLICAAFAAAIFGMCSCAPVESSFSTSVNYSFFLSAQYENGDSQIGVPTKRDAQMKIDSVLNAYVTEKKLGGTIHFSAGGQTPYEMQLSLHKQITTVFDSLRAEVAKGDYAELLDQCGQYWGGSLRLVYQVSPTAILAPIMKDTIVERMRINFTPAVNSRWNVTTQADPIAFYIFDANKTVYLGDSSDKLISAEYTVDEATGYFTIPSSIMGGEHQLNFISQSELPSFVSSPSGKRFVLQQ